jgi:hypothetical protein
VRAVFSCLAWPITDGLIGLKKGAQRYGPTREEWNVTLWVGPEPNARVYDPRFSYKWQQVSRTRTVEPPPPQLSSVFRAHLREIKVRVLSPSRAIADLCLCLLLLYLFVLARMPVHLLLLVCELA